MNVTFITRFNLQNDWTKTNRKQKSALANSHWHSVLSEHIAGTQGEQSESTGPGLFWALEFIPFFWHIHGSFSKILEHQVVHSRWPPIVGFKIELLRMIMLLYTADEGIKHPPWKNIWSIFKPQIELTYDPSILCLGYIPRRTESISSYKSAVTHAQSSFIASAQSSETTQHWLRSKFTHKPHFTFLLFPCLRIGRD